MTFPILALHKLLDWIEDRVEDGVAQISDEEIADRFRLKSDERGRAMLIDLVDRKMVSIQYVNGDRLITVGKSTRSTLQTPRPTPSVTRQLATPQSDKVGVERIKAALARVTKTSSPDRQAPKQAETGQDGRGEGAQGSGNPARVDPAPQPKTPVDAARQDSRSAARALAKEQAARGVTRDTYQVNVKVPATVYETLRRRAKGGPIGAVAREIMLGAMDRPITVEPAPKPLPLRIPASVVAAAVRDSIPVFDLAATLMARGLVGYEADAAAERSAIA